MNIIKRAMSVVLSVAFLLSIAALPIISKADESTRPTLAVLLDISCPHCRAFMRTADRIERLAKATGVNLVYAPVPQSGNIDTAWPSRTYYASRNLPGDLSRNVLTTMMASQDIHAVKTKGDVVVWMQLKWKGKPINWERFVDTQAASDKTKAAVKRAVTLAGAVHISQFPTFAVVGDGNKAPYQIADGEDKPLKERIKKVIKWMKNHKQATTKNAGEVE